ncbi:MAG: transposase [Microcoleus vaginatus WJT46-NPBG5]|nr:transposase [Microcoleus vaginatus WJT46-NPBG5]
MTWNLKCYRINALLTPGNVDDRQPVPQLLQQLSGKVFGDRGIDYQAQTEHEKPLDYLGSLCCFYGDEPLLNR